MSEFFKDYFFRYSSWRLKLSAGLLVLCCSALIATYSNNRVDGINFGLICGFLSVWFFMSYNKEFSSIRKTDKNELQNYKR